MSTLGGGATGGAGDGDGMGGGDRKRLGGYNGPPADFDRKLNILKRKT